MRTQHFILSSQAIMFCFIHKIRLVRNTADPYDTRTELCPINSSAFDKFFISCSHASGTPCNVRKNINNASYAASPLIRLSTVSDTSTKAMRRGLCHMVAIRSIPVKGNTAMVRETIGLIFTVQCARKLFHLDQPSSNTLKSSCRNRINQM